MYRPAVVASVLAGVAGLALALSAGAVALGATEASSAARRHNRSFAKAS
jgi:hypothetical protein